MKLEWLLRPQLVYLIEILLLFYNGLKLKEFIGIKSGLICCGDFHVAGYKVGL